MLKVLLLSIALFGLQVNADIDVDMDLNSNSVESIGEAMYVAPQCPKISSDHQKALTNLNKIKNDILAQAGCESLSEATARLQNIVEPGRKKAYEIILKKKGKMLTTVEAAAVEAYATQVGQAASEVFGLMGFSDCPISKEKKSLVYRSLMGLTFDAVSGLGGVSGPYGAPLSMGFTALKGVLHGVYNYNQQNKGYKFNVSTAGRDEAKLYVQSLCTFYDFKNEAEKLLNASDRKNSYLNLDAHLERKISTLSSSSFCTGCDQLIGLVDSYESVSPEVKKIVNEINSKNRQKFGDHILDALQTKLWLENQMQKLDVEELEYNESVGPAILGKELEELEDFLVYTETKDFMKWIYNETNSSYSDYRKDVSAWTLHSHIDLEEFQLFKKGRLIAEINYPMTMIRKPRNFVSVYDYKEYLLNNQDKLPNNSLFRDELLIQSKYNKSVRVLKNVNRFISSHNEYCNFFKLAGYYDAVHLQCNNKKMTKLNDAFLRQVLPDPSLSGYLEKTKKDKVRLSKMSNKLEEWSFHLPKLFNRWNKVEEKQKQINLSSPF